MDYAGRNFSCEFVFFRQSFGLKENGALRLRWVLKTWLMCLGLKCMNFNGTKKQRKHTDLTGWEVLMTPSIRFQGGLKPAMVFVFEIQANNVLGFYIYIFMDHCQQTSCFPFLQAAQLQNQWSLVLCEVLSTRSIRLIVDAAPSCNTRQFMRGIW